MATAEKTTVTREVTTTVEEEVIDLRLTVEEALALRIVLGRVGGMASGTRGRTQAIFDALGDAGVPWDYRQGDSVITGRINFND